MGDTTHTIRVRIDPAGARAGANEVKQELRGVETAATQAAAKTTLIGRAMGNLQTQVTSLAGAFGGLSAGIAAFQSVKVISDFGDQMATVRSVTLATDSDFAKLRETARTLGATTRFTATQAAQGLELLARAGASVEGSLQLIVPTLQLAQAENLGLAEASDYLAKITQGMRLQLSEGARVADVLSKTSAATATDVRQLGAAMRYAAAISAGFKTPVEEVAAALGVLANNGLVADQAGTAIRGLLSRTAAPTKEFVKDLKSVGLSLKDLDPETNSLIEILEKLAKANITTSKAFEIFKQRAGTGAEILVNNIAAVKELRSQLEGARGTLQQKFDIKADTLLNDLFTALSAVTDLIIAVGDAGLERALRLVLQAFTFVVKTLDEKLTALTPLIQAVGVAVAVAFTPTAINLFIGALTRLLALLPLVIAGFQRLGAAMLAFAFSNPFTAILAGLTLVISVAAQFADRIGIIGTRFATLADLFAVIGDRIANGFAFIRDRVGDAFAAIGRAGAAVGNYVVKVFQDVANSVLDFLQAITNAAAAAVNAVGGLLNLGTVGEINLGKLDFGNIAPPDFIGSILKDADSKALDRLALEKKARIDLVGALHRQALAEAELNRPKNPTGDDGTKKRLTQLERMKQILGEFNDPAEEANANLLALNTLFDKGKISASQYADGLQKIRTTLLEADQTVGRGILGALNEIAKGASQFGANVEKFIVGAFNKASDAIADFVTTGKFNFSNFVSSVLSDLVKLSTNLLFGQLAQAALGGAGGGGFGNLFGGGIGGLSGFATGGSFNVGGSGGTDSQITAFRSTPGERVTVETPQQQSRSGGQSGTIINIINQSGAQVRTEKRRGAGGAEINDIVIAAVGDGVARGQLDAPLGGRFGVGPNQIRR